MSKLSELAKECDRLNSQLTDQPAVTCDQCGRVGRWLYVPEMENDWPRCQGCGTC